ncbi:PREDICTED: nuclear receptor coactivator 7 [Ipomoea nil]|uniref:nuclear receptor coactivator 7 n=1 Tax=Ipomoea nil TaxID=35883 RepID=UPI0009011BB0|nr:PREDICTED: nuclear receptor coactivator 7 [Ipomoea nil]XP_019181347.1 PREDICTED: nuclear receptor coactivator 7 [Ipomoea nil]
MHSIKERVSETLSRLFSDSPIQSVDNPPQPQAQPQAGPETKDGKTLTSVLSFVLPSSKFDRLKSLKEQHDNTPVHSPSFTWRSRSFKLEDKPLERFDDYDLDDDYKDIPDFNGEDEFSRSNFFNAQGEICEPNSARSVVSCYEDYEDARDGVDYEVMPNLINESLFVTPDLYEFLQASLPNIVKGCQWMLLYSTDRDGISLRTLIHKSADTSGPCLLITGDKEGSVFGGLLEAPLTPTAKPKYQGTNQSFVFTTLYGEPRMFRPTGANRYFFLCMYDQLAFGGGENYALSVDGDLLTGSSGPCETFGNLCLANNQEFQLKNVELWGFTHASRYLV